MLEESENPVSYNYYDVDGLNKIQIHQHDLSIIHLNISSLASHIHELKLFLSLLKVSFDIICISESRISKHNLPTININIPGYNTEHTPTESKAGGTLMYISEKISYKICNDLNIYNPKQLESIFIEILRPDLPGGIVGTIYKHPSMNVFTFNAEFFAPLLKNLNKENKVILTGDFNVNLLNFGRKRGTHQFLEELFHNNYTPQITLPTRITDRSATLIDNIFLNTQRHKQTSGNITTSISDHLPQFTILEKFLGTRNIIGKEQITY